jgi:hypothetical protein
MINIKNLSDLIPFKNVFQKDENDREINLYKIGSVKFIKNKNLYPNVLLSTSEGFIRPINETVMSLKEVKLNNNIHNTYKTKKNDSNPHFFFIYNTDNYYHFVYDSLPYLISYFKLKSEINNLKLLMNYPNNQKKDFYKFVTEFLELLSISENDITIVDPHTEYSELYISTSYTHDGKSNLPPRNEIYDFYQNIVNTVKNKNIDNISLPKKIYISRRTWISNDTSNIGTNYTTKRKMVNEDDVVAFFKSNGFVEVFSESLSTDEKILLFNSASHIVGPIGGGLCNALFCNKDCKIDILNSPIFFDINKRFIYSFKTKNYKIIDYSSHTEKTEIKKFMRVKFDNKVGEVIDINDDTITIIYSKIEVSGWNNEVKFETITKNIKDIQKLDGGLNSQWVINLDKIKTLKW